MATTAYSFRLSEPAEVKLRELAVLYGSQARVIEVAIDRLYHSEIGEKNEMKYVDGLDLSAQELEEITYLLNETVDPAAQEGDVATCLLDAPRDLLRHGAVDEIVKWISSTVYSS